jgi:RNA polymerase-binding protein DksA
MNSEQTRQMRDLLEKRRDDLTDVLADTETIIHEQLAPADGNESRVDFNHPADMVSEAGDPDYEKELHILERQRAELSLVNQALVRLDTGRFGICEECEQEIPLERLQAVPYTRSCIACSAKAERAAATAAPRPPMIGAAPRSNAADAGIRP